jgi:aspartate-semialdehyde dehydrogenase
MKSRLGILGACGSSGFAWIAQSVLCSLEDHPYFEVVGMVSENQGQEGSTFGESMAGWYEERPLQEAFKELPMLLPDGKVLREQLGIDLVISALPGYLSKVLDTQLAASGMPVVSESPGLRDVPNIPLITPEINPDHLEIISEQQKSNGWERGFIVANPACTITILALPLKPLLDHFGIQRVILATMQAISGAGHAGIPGLDIIDNLIPYIKLEEEKVTTEGQKIFGNVFGGEIKNAEFPISATCTRLPITDGHTGAIFVECSQPVSVNEAASVMREFSALPQELGLPSAPVRPLIVTDRLDRPQPRLDRYTDAGRAVTVGRIRPDEALTNGIKFVVMGHNRFRGTFGNTILLAELLHKQGYLSD